MGKSLFAVDLENMKIGEKELENVYKQFFKVLLQRGPGKMG